MARQDGVDHLLRAAAALLRAPRRLRTRCSWATARCSRRCASSPRSLGVEDIVEFTGRVEPDDGRPHAVHRRRVPCPDPRNPLNDVSSMNKIPEYMAMGRPIVAYDCASPESAPATPPSSPPPNDDAGSSADVARLLDDPERRAAMGAAGRGRAEGGARLGAPGALVAAGLRPCARHRGTRPRPPEGTATASALLDASARSTSRPPPITPRHRSPPRHRPIRATSARSSSAATTGPRHRAQPRPPRHPGLRDRRRASITQFSRYAMHCGLCPDLRDEARWRRLLGRAAWASTAGCSIRPGTRPWRRSRNRERLREYSECRPPTGKRCVGLGQAQHLSVGRGAGDPNAAQPGTRRVETRSGRHRAAVRAQAGDQGALLLRHQGQGLARRQPRGAARAAREGARRSSARER